MTVVIAEYGAAPGGGDEVARLLREHAGVTRREPGCVQFLVNRSIESPDDFVLYEQYVDDAAFEAHRASPHFERYVVNGVVPLLERRTWRTYELVEPSD